MSVEKTPGVSLATRHLDFSDLPSFDFFVNDYAVVPRFDFADAGIRLVAGETFNIVVTADAGSNGSDAGYYFLIGAYDRGAGFLRHPEFGDLPYGGDLDQGFRTYVEVPEPATWALMIGGFGLAGAGIRRRKGLAV